MLTFSENAKKRAFFIPEIVAIGSSLLYIIQATYYSLYQLPNLDEGAYLFKGLQFALGNYRPFQPYGFWTNKMYLSFFIWGWIQRIFTPGLLTSRISAIILSFLALLGTWILARRLGNRWLAALVVFILALNPTLISIYSLANSQVLIYLILTWVLVLIMGKRRPFWQVIVGAFLSALMVLTRENMVFVLPFLIVYIFILHGKKIGLYSVGTIALVLAIGHAIYWPSILTIWTRWLPDVLALFGVHNANNAVKLTNSVSLSNRFQSLATAFRVYFLPFLIVFFCLIFWPRKNRWQDKEHQLNAYFLASTFFVLLIVHTWASIGNDYCVYCSITYFAFFINLALLLFSTCFSSLTLSGNKKTILLMVIAIPISISLIFFSLYEQIGLNLINISVPRINAGKLLQGNVALWQLLQNKFGLQIQASRSLVPVIFGLLSGLLILLAGFFIHKFTSRRWHQSFSFSLFIFVAMLGVATSYQLSQLPTTNTCKTTVTTLYQNIGAKLEEVIPSKSSIYLDGRLAAIPLLYLNGVNYYPPQINDQFSFKEKPDTDELLQQGLWNQTAANLWKSESNVFIIESDRISDWRNFLDKKGFIELSLDSEFSSCPDNSRLHIFVRKTKIP